MASKLIVERSARGFTSRTIEIVDRPEAIGPLAHPLAWRILSELARGPAYPSAVAKRLRLHEQKVYYHIHRLAAAGLIRVVREEPRGGTRGRVYAPAAEAFGVELPGRAAPLELPVLGMTEPLRRFLEPFRPGRTFDGLVVVGAPTPHGPFLTAARDGPYAVELAWALGRLFSPSDATVVWLDTEVKSSGRETENLILVGGPVANIISFDLNAHLEVRFDWREVWRLESRRTGQRYGEDSVGLLARVPNPWRKGRAIVLVSGIHHRGTLASILAVTRFPDRVLEGYHGEETFHRVIEGLDRDGDGRVDDIATRE